MTTTIENLGRTNLEVIREMLLGNKNIEQAANETRKNAKSEGVDGPDTSTAWLYTRYDKGHPTCVKIARRNASQGVHAALQLFVRKHGDGTATWYVEPFPLRSEFVRDRDRYMVALDEHWIHLLLRYVEDVFDDLKAGSGLEQDEDQDRLQQQRFEVRVRRFQLHGPKKFFVKPAAKSAKDAMIPDPVVWARWDIVSRWDDWNRAKTVDWEKRLAEIKKLGHHFTCGSFKNVCGTTLKLRCEGPGTHRQRGKK